MKTILKYVSIMLATFGLVWTTWAQNSLSQAGKIWYDDGFLYVNIINEGVLVINNFDPKSPKKVGFIQIPGNVDMAVRGNILYANAHQDLVALDISDLNAIKEVRRIPSVFTHRPRAAAWDNNTIAWRTGNDLQNIIRNAFGGFSLIGGGFNNGNFGIMGNSFGNTNPLLMSAAPVAKAPANRPTGGGRGGSMACFVLMDNFLYAIDSRDLLVFSIRNPASPELIGQKIPVGSDIETLFGYENRLFVGSQSGMYIFDATERVRPQLEGTYRHVRSCDPVVVEGQYAYVTLRNGSDCGGNVNQLDVIDISNPSRPQKIRTYAMKNPHGLGIDNGLLFICDGYDGLKVFDATNPRAIKQVAHFANIQTYDVIPDSHRKILIMVGGNKITQYDYRDPFKLSELSTLDLSSTADIQTVAR
ncbi:MAG: hypothetical protein RMJ87_10770 [Cytophagales bacterium]|nr:hypothetical protein [Bernardetiaceae bacterium]MDW8205502.1 hypothetical protein [Cytophagales bacterium]